VPPAWRNRLTSVAVVMLCAIALRELYPDAAKRAQPTYILVIALGYGHLVGGVVFARARMLRWLPRHLPPGLATALGTTSLLAVFAAYTALLPTWPGLVFPLLGVALWHAFENDVALERTYAQGLRAASVSRDRAHHLLALGLAALCAALFAAAAPAEPVLESPYQGFDFELLGTLSRLLAAGTGAAAIACRGRGTRAVGAALVLGTFVLPGDVTAWLGLADVFAIFTLYHVVSWSVLVAERIRERARTSPAAARGLAGRIFLVHALPIALCALALRLPSDRDGALRVLVFSPAVYLFWSALHAIQTLAVRGFATRRETRCAIR
jgi:hypothetical protein